MRTRSNAFLSAATRQRLDALVKDAERDMYRLGVGGIFIGVLAAVALGVKAADIPVAAQVLVGLFVGGAILYGIWMVHLFGVQRGMSLNADMLGVLDEEENNDGSTD